MAALLVAAIMPRLLQGLLFGKLFFECHLPNIRGAATALPV
jgi:hypothetical protein